MSMPHATQNLFHSAEVVPADIPPPPAPVSSNRRRARRRQGGAGEGLNGGGAGNFSKPGRLMEDLAQVEWMLSEFKTQPCTHENPTSHDHRCCPFFHSSRDRRRPTRGGSLAVTYRGEPCNNQFDDQRTCAEGDACTMCHSTAELLYHPEFFRKRLCHQSRKCPRGRYCAFAHNRQELLVPHFGEGEEGAPTEEFITHRFKTQWCPVGGPHDWENCVYAHTYRDWRRVPILGYSSHPCPRWTNSVSNGTSELSYSDRCCFGMACPLAHGAKEQLYHPQFYKTSPCSDSNCTRRALCAFTHGEDPRPVEMDDASAKAARKPIPGAEELLKLYQPTYIEPPMYHALEDAPRTSGSSSKSKAKNKKQSQPQQPRSAPGSATINLAMNLPSATSGCHSAPGSAMISLGSAGDASQRVPQMPMMPIMPAQSGGVEAPMMVVPGPFGPCVYQWVPSAEQLQDAGSRQPGAEQRPMSMGTIGGQMMYNPMMGTPGLNAANPAFLNVQQPGPSPAPMDSPLRVKTKSEVNMDASDVPPKALFNADDYRIPGLPNLLGCDPTGQMGRMAELYVKDAERDILAWQQGAGRKYCQKDGYRTPSSWGSPPLSGVGTAVNSPRGA